MALQRLAKLYLPSQHMLIIKTFEDPKKQNTISSNNSFIYLKENHSYYKCNSF